MLKGYLQLLTPAVYSNFTAATSTIVQSGAAWAGPVDQRADQTPDAVPRPGKWFVT